MDYEVTDITEHPPNEFSEVAILAVEILIEGFKINFTCELDADIAEYIESHYQELLATAQKHSLKPRIINRFNSLKDEYKQSALYGLTHAQLETYIDNNVTNLAEAKAFLKKLSAVVLCLVKQNKLDE